MAESTSGSPCHHTAVFAIRAFANALEAESRDGAVAVEVIRRLADALAAAPGPLAPRFASAESSCTSRFTSRQYSKVRRNLLGRVIAHPLGGLLGSDAYGIRRNQLAGLFTAIRLIIGDEVYETLQGRCMEIFGQLDGELTRDRWDTFYAHPEIRRMGERVHVAVARAFRRFDTRKDWFMTIMNNTSAAQSLGGSAFVVKKRDESIPFFSEKHLAALLAALLRGYRDLPAERAAEFQARWGEPPEKVFGPVYVEIARIGVPPPPKP